MRRRLTVLLAQSPLQFRTPAFHPIRSLNSPSAGATFVFPGFYKAMVFKGLAVPPNRPFIEVEVRVHVAEFSGDFLHC